MSRRRATMVALLAAAALVGCGDDDDKAPGGGSPVNDGQQPGATSLPAPSDSPRGETTKDGD